LFKKKKIKNNSEKELILLSKKDSRFFAPIYKKYHEQIFRFIYHRMNTEAEAEDITSQVFLKALTNLGKYKFQGHPFSSWLYKVAINELNQYYRKTNKQRIVNIKEESDIKEVVVESGEEKYDDIKREQLLKTLSTLEENKLLLIEMRFFEKRSFKEIGLILNITENNAKVRTYRVLDEMKKNML